MIKNYRPRLNLYETQSAIGFIKQTFQFELSRRLHLMRATAPLFVDPATGLNDDLSGIERPVSFDIPGVRDNTLRRELRDAVKIVAEIQNAAAEISLAHIHESDLGYVRNCIIGDHFY